MTIKCIFEIPSVLYVGINIDNDDSDEANSDVLENHLFGSVGPTQSPDTPMTSLEIYIKIYT